MIKKCDYFVTASASILGIRKEDELYEIFDNIYRWVVIEHAGVRAGYFIRSRRGWGAAALEKFMVALPRRRTR